MSWWKQAACRQAETDYWFPTDGDDTKTMCANAKAVCAKCTVREECLQWALDHESFGVWGGTTEKERILLRRRQNIKRRTPGLALGRQSHDIYNTQQHKERTHVRS